MDRGYREWLNGVAGPDNSPPPPEPAGWFLPPDSEVEWDCPLTLEELASAIQDQMPEGFVCTVDESHPGFVRVVDPEGVWLLQGGAPDAIIAGAEDMVSEHTTDPCTIVIALHPDSPAADAT